MRRIRRTVSQLPTLLASDWTSNNSIQFSISGLSANILVLTFGCCPKDVFVARPTTNPATKTTLGSRKKWSSKKSRVVPFFTVWCALIDRERWLWHSRNCSMLPCGQQHPEWHQQLRVLIVSPCGQRNVVTFWRTVSPNATDQQRERAAKVGWQSIIGPSQVISATGLRGIN